MPLSFGLIPLYDNACAKKGLSKKAKTIDESISQSQISKKNQQVFQLEMKFKIRQKRQIQLLLFMYWMPSLFFHLVFYGHKKIVSTFNHNLFIG